LLNRVRQPFNVNSLALVAATAALNEDGFVDHARATNLQGLDYLSSALSALGLSVVPSAGNFLLVDMGRPAGPVYERLLKAGIIVRPVANYGLPNHLRITVGLPEQNRRLMEVLGADPEITS
jgi:histidinol-phosphate aminotransferase